MGVNSLWDILGPTARPVRLEALTRKRLAVDASIWIYQFLKAVRDSEGNTLHSSHIVGFFRRICKLLYFGIQPVFIFDGGAPALKRDTIKKRKERRDGKREDASETAHRLLAIHAQRRVQQPKENNDDTVYLEDLPGQHPNHIQHSPSRTGKRFVPSDEYHLPELKKIKIRESDERLLPDEEYRELASESFDIVDGIDINSVNPNSEEFAELPMSTQYMILSHLRLKSRLRMGFSKEQLENIFTDSMDFSKFQIQQVQKRNFYTQRLMDASGMGEDGNATRRIAGEKDRKYALIRTDDGWALSLGQEDDHQVVEKAPVELNPQFPEIINISDKSEDDIEVGDEDDDDDDDFEDVSIGEAPVENAEDQELNRAVIESIYEQYEDKPVSKATDEFSQDELKLAIEKSKKELSVLVQREEAMITNQTVEPFDFNFGDSLLFSSNQSAEPVNAYPKSHKPQKEVPETIVEEEEPESYYDRLGRKEKELEHLDQLEALMESEEETDKKDTAKQNSVPEWFNEKLEANSVYQNFQAEREDSVEKDEDVGLIPWDKAKEMLDNESEDEDPHEVEEISHTNLVDSVEDESIVISEANTQGIEDPVDVPEVEEKDTEVDVKVEPVEETSSKTSRKDGVLDYVFVDDEDELADRQLLQEEKDHDKLKRDIAAHHEPLLNITTSITEEQLLQERLLKQKRDSEEVTQAMINDVQELLRRFGIPFLTAPMEAEAQCVELLKLGLVDGIVTDDSDTFLFGGDRVYKNMFNQKQFVECYLSEDVSGKLGLSQEKLIELGLLLGSDYTEGVKGIGPVLAMEILAEFGSLHQFKEWFDDCNLRAKNDSSSSLKKNLLNRIKNSKLFLPPSFPDSVVFDAYIHPEVDHSKDPIKWGVPDLDSIRSFLMYNVGWSQGRVDEVMVPLIRDLNRKLREGTQSTIGEFFSTSYIQSKREVQIGKRMKAAATKLNKKAAKDGL